MVPLIFLNCEITRSSSKGPSSVRRDIAKCITSLVHSSIKKLSDHLSKFHFPACSTLYMIDFFPTVF